jgi:hypothetical protein
MADDRMKNNDDLQRNMGANREDQDYGQQQSPGRGGQGQGGQQQGGQHGGGQQSGGQFGGQQGTQKHQMEEDDDLGGYGGSQNRGGQNR